MRSKPRQHRDYKKSLNHIIVADQVPKEYEDWTLPIPTDDDVKRAEQLGIERISARGNDVGVKKGLSNAKQVRGNR